MFIVFSIWSFAFYGQMFVTDSPSLASTLEDISEKVLDNLTVKVYTLPVKANATVPGDGFGMYFQYDWPLGKNTTKVFKGNRLVNCGYEGNILYFWGRAAVGINYYKVKYSEQESDLNCDTDPIPAFIDDAQVSPFSAEESNQLSQARISFMESADYSAYKSGLGIFNDFNVKLTYSNSSELEYGPEPPGNSNIFSKEFQKILEETDELVTIRFLTW